MTQALALPGCISIPAGTPVEIEKKIGDADTRIIYLDGDNERHLVWIPDDIALKY